MIEISDSDAKVIVSKVATLKTSSNKIALQEALRILGIVSKKLDKKLKEKQSDGKK